MSASFDSLLSQAQPTRLPTSLVYGAVVRHQTALAWEMMRQGAAFDPNETHAGVPLVHAALRPSPKGASMAVSSSPSAQVDMQACQDWSALSSQVGNLERLACLLILAGANPAAVDAQGHDVLDLAFYRGYRSLWSLCRIRMPEVDLNTRLIDGQPLAVAAVQASAETWLDTLCAAGVEVESADQSGLPLSAHCPDAASFVRCVAQGWGPRTHAQAQMLLNHWLRMAKKGGPYWHASMQEALRSMALDDGALGPEKMVMAKQVEEWLRHPDNQYVPIVSPEESAPWVGLRHTVARGPHRGCWSAEAAEALARLRTSAQSANPSALLAPAVWDNQADLEIRPGLTARGLGLLLTCLVDAPNEVSFYTQRMAGKEIDQLAQEGIDSLKALVTAQSAFPWRTRATDVLVGLDRKFVGLLEKDGTPAESVVRDYATLLPALNFNANFLNRDWLLSFWTKACPPGAPVTATRLELALGVCLADLGVESNHKGPHREAVVTQLQDWLAQQGAPETPWRLGESAQVRLKDNDAELLRLFRALHLQSSTPDKPAPGLRTRM